VLVDFGFAVGVIDTGRSRSECIGCRGCTHARAITMHALFACTRRWSQHVRVLCVALGQAGDDAMLGMALICLPLVCVCY
jgi:hypothetical protein